MMWEERMIENQMSPLNWRIGSTSSPREMNCGLEYGGYGKRGVY